MKTSAAQPQGYPVRPGRIASGLVVLSVRMLPAESRARYGEEFRADLRFIPAGRQPIVAMSLLLGAWQLARAIRQGSPVAHVGGPARSWRGRLGMHHYAMAGDGNPENGRAMHLECGRCARWKAIGSYSRYGDFPALGPTIAGHGPGRP